MHDDLLDVYQNHNTKRIRFVYYNKNKLTKLSNAKIVFDGERIFVTSNNIDTKISSRVDLEYRNFDEDKTDIIENFSQTGSYYNINGKYTLSQGIFNIINRAKEESDDYYNIVFDVVIPEDQHIVNKIFDATNKRPLSAMRLFESELMTAFLKLLKLMYIPILMIQVLLFAKVL